MHPSPGSTQKRRHGSCGISGKTLAATPAAPADGGHPTNAPTRNRHGRNVIAHRTGYSCESTANIAGIIPANRHAGTVIARTGKIGMARGQHIPDTGGHIDAGPHAANTTAQKGDGPVTATGRKQCRSCRPRTVDPAVPDTGLRPVHRVPCARTSPGNLPPRRFRASSCLPGACHGNHRRWNAQTGGCLVPEPFRTRFSANTIRTPSRRRSVFPGRGATVQQAFRTAGVQEDGTSAGSDPKEVRLQDVRVDGDPPVM